jgi:hypothetical protein
LQWKDGVDWLTGGTWKEAEPSPRRNHVLMGREAMSIDKLGKRSIGTVNQFCRERERGDGWGAKLLLRV